MAEQEARPEDHELNVAKEKYEEASAEAEANPPVPVAEEEEAAAPKKAESSAMLCARTGNRQTPPHVRRSTTPRITARAGADHLDGERSLTVALHVPPSPEAEAG